MCANCKSVISNSAQKVWVFATNPHFGNIMVALSRFLVAIFNFNEEIEKSFDFTTDDWGPQYSIVAKRMMMI